MKRFEIIVVVLTCCGLYIANLHAESQKSSVGDNTKQQTEIVTDAGDVAYFSSDQEYG